MGNLSALISILVGGLGFFLWVVIVSILGPVFLHRLLATGTLFMNQAAGVTARQSLGAGRLAWSLAHGAGGMPLRHGGAPGERLAGSRPVEAVAIAGAISAVSMQGGSSMANAARAVDVSDGKSGERV